MGVLNAMRVCNYLLELVISNVHQLNLEKEIIYVRNVMHIYIKRIGTILSVINSVHRTLIVDITSNTVKNMNIKRVSFSISLTLCLVLCF